MPSDRSLKILILGLNYAPEMVGIGVYTAGLAEALVQRGHQVDVVAGKPYYPAWRVPDSFRGGWTQNSIEFGVSITRVAHYVPTKPTGVRRILHHASFALSSLIPAWRIARRKRPDIVLTVAPSLIAAPVARLAALACDARSWLHVQDFEVEAAVATGLLRNSGLVARLASRLENLTLGIFDRVSSISPAMCKKLKQKGIPSDKIIEFRNWAEILTIRPLVEVSPYRAVFGISRPYVALYSGNISNKQGIDIVVSAARLLRHRDDLMIVVCGEGPNKVDLEEKARDLDNIRFFDLQPKERLGDLLGLATLHLLPQLASAADLVLPSKLTNMLASGRAVIATAHSGTGLAQEVEGCGLVVEPENAEALADAIAQLLDDDARRRAFGIAARRRAEVRWDREELIDKLQQGLLQLAGSVAQTTIQNHDR